ncbi:hypothetical protein [Niallia taxi]|uniref:hypothetical protein n=1 Tax=Niallia taxi TaxID=2499688 RepID=UPI00119FD996|nr:hypothetical protein [Niallia taxi]MCT2343871.1 hypothetical protein [Niallia taxi]MDE5051891.1 hypothetical protein [Niallia taxi]MED3963738.1 hypothetical protein [Niallia taxi]WOD61671.1 hypothetical protein NQZ71_12660 [Niallia taxi]
MMNIQAKNQLYTINDKEKTYTAMEFKRMDWINKQCYITFQQASTGQWYTFERSSIFLHMHNERNLVS